MQNNSYIQATEITNNELPELTKELKKLPELTEKNAQEKQIHEIEEKVKYIVSELDKTNIVSTITKPSSASVVHLAKYFTDDFYNNYKTITLAANEAAKIGGDLAKTLANSIAPFKDYANTISSAFLPIMKETQNIKINPANVIKANSGSMTRIPSDYKSD